MYKDGFVLSVVHKGRPVREIGGICRIPFNNEYEILLKNKKNTACKVKVFIDGTLVNSLGDLVISAGGTLKLERFLDNSLSSGKKFKFVSIKDSRVSDPTSGDNGKIKVEFYEGTAAYYINTVWTSPPESDHPWKKYSFRDSSGNNWYYSSNISTCGGSAGTISAYNSNSESDKGATVEGGDSNQNFVSVSDFNVCSAPVVLELQLRAPVDARTTIEDEATKFCSYCGKKRFRRHRYCPRCGKKF